MQPLPLQVPGFMELAVIVLIFTILAVPLALLLGLIVWLRRRSESADETESEIQQLEAQVAELEAKVDSLQDDSSD